MAFKFTDYVITVLVVGMFISIIVIAAAYMTQYYGTPDATAELAGYGELNETQQILTEMDNKNKEIASKEGSFDVIGDFFSQGYTSFKLMRSSAEALDKVATTAASKSDIGEAGNIYLSYFKVILLAIFILAIVGIALKWEI